MAGLLLYSIDSFLNQLIVYLSDEFEHLIKIEIRGTKAIISLEDLCNCTKCLYQKFQFTFRLKEYLEIQCNNGVVRKTTFPVSKIVNFKYPVPDFYDKTVSTYMWLGNIPEYENKYEKVYPNNYHISGCIFELKHGDDILDINFFGSGISAKCKQQCARNTCNDGDCLETFEYPPICDCYESFYNGNTCHTHDARRGSFNLEFPFKSLKMSWNYSVKQIFQLNYNDSSLVLHADDSKLYLTFSNTVTFANELIQDYSYNNSYVIILTPDMFMIKLQLKDISINVWSSFDINVNRNLSMNYFKELKIFDNSCNFDVTYRRSKDDSQWYPISNQYNIKFQNDSSDSCFHYKSIAVQLKSNGSSNDYAVIFLEINDYIIMIFVFVNGALLVVLVLICRKKYRKTNLNQEEQVSSSIIIPKMCDSAESESQNINLKQENPPSIPDKYSIKYNLVPTYKSEIEIIRINLI